MHDSHTVKAADAVPSDNGLEAHAGMDFNALAHPLTSHFEHARLTVTPLEREVSPAELTGRLEAILRKLYPAKEDAPYHNWDHAFVDVKNNAKEIAVRLKAVGLELDEVALYHAILGHDILHGLNNSLLNFDSKEQLASHYIYNLLRSLGAPEAHARKVEGIINATHHAVEPKSAEEIAIRAADLAGLAGDFSTFIEHTRRLHQEERNSTGKDISFPDFVRNSLGFLPLYVWRFLQLSNAATNERGASVWHERTLNNLVALFSSINSGRENIRVVAQVPLKDELLPIVNLRLGAGAFYIGADADPVILEQAVAHSHEYRALTNDRIPAFYVPGSANSLPLCDGMCDELHVMDTAGFNVGEASRVLRSGGDLFVYAADSLPDNLIKIITAAGFSCVDDTSAPVHFVKVEKYS